MEVPIVIGGGGEHWELSCFDRVEAQRVEAIVILRGTPVGWVLCRAPVAPRAQSKLAMIAQSLFHRQPHLFRESKFRQPQIRL